MLGRYLHEALQGMNPRSSSKRMGQVFVRPALVDKLRVAHALDVTDAHEDGLRGLQSEAIDDFLFSRPRTSDCINTIRWSLSQMRPSPSAKCNTSVRSENVGDAPVSSSLLAPRVRILAARREASASDIRFPESLMITQPFQFRYS
jgi:hypothetical protein